MQNKTTREALLSIIHRLKNSKILFKSFYEKHKDKFDKIESNIDNFEKQLEHLNHTLNIYKWLLFISKTKEELFENMDLVMKKPDGSPMILTDEIKERLFENSKPFQMFILLLELSRTKYKNVDFQNPENLKLFEKMKTEQLNNDSQIILNKLFEQENIQEGGNIINNNMNTNMNLSYINNEKAYFEYMTNLKTQTGGSSQDKDFNRHRFVKFCYELDTPLPLKIPTVEFLNFKFDNNNNRYCIDIEYPWWPTMGNMLPELFNKANIKQCLKNKCVTAYKDVKVKDSPEKQECVKECFNTSQPSIFDFTFFPLWSLRKYDSFGVIGGGVSFIKFFMNQLDSTMGKIDPLLDKLFGYIIELIGVIPIFGDIVNFLSRTFEDIADRFGDSLIPWFNSYIEIIDKNFEEGFAIYATTIPNATKMASSAETTVAFLDKMMPLFNTALSGVDMATNFLANTNFTNIVNMFKNAGNTGNTGNAGISIPTGTSSNKNTEQETNKKSAPTTAPDPSPNKSSSKKTSAPAPAPAPKKKSTSKKKK